MKCTATIEIEDTRVLDIFVHFVNIIKNMK